MSDHFGGPNALTIHTDSSWPMTHRCVNKPVRCQSIIWINKCWFIVNCADNFKWKWENKVEYNVYKMPSILATLGKYIRWSWLEPLLDRVVWVYIGGSMYFELLGIMGAWERKGIMRVHGFVSLTSRELSKILSRNLCIAEIVLLIMISSWNFVLVHKVSAWNSHHKGVFCHCIYSQDPGDLNKILDKTVQNSF